MIRIGHGFDVHRLVEGRKLIMGGVAFDHPKGLLGHSDADVLLHAVCDALLGAAALGDVGKLFPDSSAEYKDISSLTLLRRVAHKVAENGYDVGNIDVTVAAEEPKLAPYIDEMRRNVASAAGCDAGRISVKATTTEKLGFTGRGEGIAAWAVALIVKRSA